MIVLGQDPIVTMGELGAVTLAQAGLDAAGLSTGTRPGVMLAHFTGDAIDMVTSSWSAVYDFARAQGNIPTTFGAGVYWDANASTRLPISFLPDGHPVLALLVYEN
jgi:hypothetical protein